MDVRIVYDGKLSRWSQAKREWGSRGPGAENQAAVDATGNTLKEVAVPRRQGPSYICHHKFILLGRGSTEVAVLTGSTNFATSSIFGQSNLVQICSEPKVLRDFAVHWAELAQDPKLRDFRHFNTQLTPSHAIIGGTSVVIFSP